MLLFHVFTFPLSHSLSPSSLFFCIQTCCTKDIFKRILFPFISVVCAIRHWRMSSSWDEKKNERRRGREKWWKEWKILCLMHKHMLTSCAFLFHERAPYEPLMSHLSKRREKLYHFISSFFLFFSFFPPILYMYTFSSLLFSLTCLGDEKLFSAFLPFLLLHIVCFFYYECNPIMSQNINLLSPSYSFRSLSLSL